MSGHSKWSTIKRKKGAADAKRGQLFTKLGRAITIAAQEGGGDPEMNFSLRMAIDKAKKESMPSDNIERAIKRGTGELQDQAAIEKAVYGGYGPGGVAIAIDVMTDNSNRTVAELRKIFEDHGANLAEASSVLWQFEKKGSVIVKCSKIKKSEKYGVDDKEVPVSQDEVMMGLMDVSGVEDVSDISAEDALDGDENPEGFEFCEVLCDAKKLAQVRSAIEEAGFMVESAELVKIPENTQEISNDDREKLEKLLEELDDHDGVENLWFNV